MVQNRKTMEAAINTAIQAAAGDNREDASWHRGNSILSELQSLAWADDARDLIPPYWSVARDVALRNFWKQPGSGHLSSAMYNAQAKLLGIPFKVEARDPSIVSHVEQAEVIEQRIRLVSEFGQGWKTAMSRWFEDYLSQDNGAFMEVIGNGSLEQAIKGAPIGIRHLDAAKCTRTGDPIYPVVFSDDTDGKEYKFHFSRVIFASQMTSSDKKYNGVGYCAVSRAIDVAQTLIDMNIYKREKLGSRPHSKLYVGKGISANDIMTAFRMADTAMDQSGFKRYSRNVAIGSEDNSDIEIDAIDLTSMEQFDEGKSVPLAMKAIALAFGMNVDELWPSGSGGADSKSSGIKVRGKLPDQVTSFLKDEFEFKLLPPHLKFTFDFQDDDEDQQAAVIRDIRARSRERNMYGGTTIAQTERRVMLRDGDINRNEFAEMERLDGRLENGAPIESLFYASDPYYTGSDGILNLGIQNPFVPEDNDREEVMRAINIGRQKAYESLGNSGGAKIVEKAKNALAALEQLEKLYQFAPNDEEDVEEPEQGESIAREEEQQDEEEMGPRFRQRTNDREGGKDTATKEADDEGYPTY